MVNIYKYSFLNSSEYIELFIYSFIGFIIPLLIGHPQVLVGIIVNAVLFLSAKNLNGMKLLPLIIAPSLGVLARGIIFGPLTIYLAYMIPFIWLGNAVLVISFRKIQFKRIWIKIVSCSFLKSALLFFSALVLFKLELFL